MVKLHNYRTTSIIPEYQEMIKKAKKKIKIIKKKFQNNYFWLQYLNLNELERQQSFIKNLKNSIKLLKNKK